MSCIVLRISSMVGIEKMKIAESNAIVKFPTKNLRFSFKLYNHKVYAENIKIAPSNTDLILYAR